MTESVAVVPGETVDAEVAATSDAGGVLPEPSGTEEAAVLPVLFAPQAVRRRKVVKTVKYKDMVLMFLFQHRPGMIRRKEVSKSQLETKTVKILLSNFWSRE